MEPQQPSGAVVLDAGPATADLPAAAAAPAPQAVSRADWLRALRYCGAVYLGVRLALLGLGVLSPGVVRDRAPVGVPGWPATEPGQPWHYAFTAWERWDALWYLSIANGGYRADDPSAAFFPLFPMLTRGVGTLLGGHPLLGAYVVSNLALIVALTVLYRLTALELSDRVARTTVLLLCVFPVGFFLFAPYTESLFLALSVGCVYAARRHSWLLAGGLGALASTTRSTGLLLVVPLAVEALLQLRASRGPLRPRLAGLAGAAAAAAAVPLGLLGYLAYWAGRGEWDRPLSLQRSNWSREPTPPWESLQIGWAQGVEGIGVFDRGFRTADLVLVLVMLVAGAAVTFRLRPSYAAYFWVSALFPLMLTDPGRPLQSVPRYYLVVFPVFWALALLVERTRAREAVVPALALGCGALALLFAAWYPVL